MLLNALYRYAKENKCKVKSEPHMPLLYKQRNAGIYLEDDSTIYLSYNFSNDDMHIICLAHELGHHMLWKDGIRLEDDNIINTEVKAWDKAEEIIAQLGFSLPKYWNRHRKSSLKSYQNMYERSV